MKDNYVGRPRVRRSLLPLLNGIGTVARVSAAGSAHLEDIPGPRATLTFVKELFCQKGYQVRTSSGHENCLGPGIMKICRNCREQRLQLRSQGLGYGRLYVHIAKWLP